MMNPLLESLYQRKACPVFTDEAVSDAIKQELVSTAM